MLLHACGNGSTGSFLVRIAGDPSFAPSAWGLLCRPPTGHRCPAWTLCEKYRQYRETWKKRPIERGWIRARVAQAPAITRRHELDSCKDCSAADHYAIHRQCAHATPARAPSIAPHLNSVFMQELLGGRALCSVTTSIDARVTRRPSMMHPPPHPLVQELLGGRASRSVALRGGPERDGPAWSRRAFEEMPRR
jgi:hypothetical protein